MVVKTIVVRKSLGRNAVTVRFRPLAPKLNITGAGIKPEIKGVSTATEFVLAIIDYGNPGLSCVNSVKESQCPVPPV
jgi:hypothetical protein